MFSSAPDDFKQTMELYMVGMVSGLIGNRWSADGQFPRFSVAIAKRLHPFPFRTRKLSSSAPMVLHGRLCGRVGRRRILLRNPLVLHELRGFVVLSVKAVLSEDAPPVLFPNTDGGVSLRSL